MEHAPNPEAYRNAFDQDQFHLVFQPQISVSSGELIGSEALLRWESERYGYVPPPEIISLAKKADHMVELGHWILQQALRHNQKFHEAGHESSFSVSVNVSPHQFLNREQQFRENVESLLGTTGHSPNLLELEITEEALIDNLEETRETLSDLIQLGISLAMDDFGTGYSSLSYLAKMPFNTLKIDREFILNINSSKPDTLLDAMIAMGRSMEMTVLAEGVDTIQQLDYLRSQGCQVYQGYLYSKPLPPDRFMNLVKQPEVAQ